jgi:hypothetical protein
MGVDEMFVEPFLYSFASQCDKLFLICSLRWFLQFIQKGVGELTDMVED